jgi:hypothetical protein
MKRLLWALLLLGVGAGVGGLVVQRLWLRPTEAQLRALRTGTDNLCYWVAVELRKLDRPDIQPEEMLLARQHLMAAVTYCAPEAQASLAAVTSAAVMDQDMAKARQAVLTTAALVDRSKQ